MKIKQLLGRLDRSLVVGVGDLHGAAHAEVGVLASVIQITGNRQLAHDVQRVVRSDVEIAVGVHRPLEEQILGGQDFQVLVVEGGELEQRDDTALEVHLEHRFR